MTVTSSFYNHKLIPESSHPYLIFYFKQTVCNWKTHHTLNHLLNTPDKPKQLEICFQICACKCQGRTLSLCQKPPLTGRLTTYFSPTSGCDLTRCRHPQRTAAKPNLVEVARSVMCNKTDSMSSKESFVV